MSTPKNRLRPMRKKKKRSTDGASVDACSGSSSLGMARCRMRRGASATPSPADEADQRQHGDETRGAHAGQHRAAVAAGARIVVVTKQQQLIDRRPNAVLGGLHQGELEIARRELDAEQVARD